MKEPLFKYDKIKDHEYVVDISIINNQFFLVNNNKQYNRLKYFFMEEDYIYGKYCHLNCFLGKYSSLIIINKYFIDKLLYEKDKEFLEKVVNKSETEFYLLYLYNYSYIYTKVFILFFSDTYDRAVVPDMTFEIFKYFYSNTHKHLLEDLIKVNEDKIEDILIEILDVYGKDINILNYCLDKIKQYNLKIKDIRGYRVPMNHCFEILKYYSDKLCAKNNLYLKCEDKYAEEFINITFADSCLKNFDYLNETFQNCFSNKYNIDFYKVDKNFEIIVKNTINTDKISTRKTEYIYDIQSKLVNIIDPQYNGKLSYINSYVLIPGDINFNFFKKFLNSYKKIDRILKDPNHILNLNIDINNYTDCLIIKLCYLASIIHNNYSKFLIYVLIYYDQYWHGICYIDNKIEFRDSYCKYTKPYYIRKIFKLLMNTPHKLFNNYFFYW